MSHLDVTERYILYHIENNAVCAAKQSGIRSIDSVTAAINRVESIVVRLHSPDDEIRDSAKQEYYRLPRGDRAVARAYSAIQARLSK